MFLEHGGLDGLSDFPLGMIRCTGLIVVGLVGLVTSMPVIQRRSRNPVLLAEGGDVWGLRFFGKQVFNLLSGTFFRQLLGVIGKKGGEKRRCLRTLITEP